MSLMGLTVAYTLNFDFNLIAWFLSPLIEFHLEAGGSTLDC